MNNMLEIFGKFHFSELELKSRVPNSIFKEFKAVQRGEKELSISVAEVIANAAKNWATEHGATHFTHWFQPLTDLTAEKHESFISISSDGNILSQFSGKELIKGESAHLLSQTGDFVLHLKQEDIQHGIYHLQCF